MSEEGFLGRFLRVIGIFTASLLTPHICFITKQSVKQRRGNLGLSKILINGSNLGNWDRWSLYLITLIKHRVSVPLAPLSFGNNFEWTSRNATPLKWGKLPEHPRKNSLFIFWDYQYSCYEQKRSLLTSALHPWILFSVWVYLKYGDLLIF